MTTLERKLTELPSRLRERVLQISYAPDAARVLTDEPQSCRECGKPHHLFVSRDGSSRCWECDSKRQAARAAADRRALGPA